MSVEPSKKMIMSTQGPPAYYAVTGVLTALNIIVVTLRFYARKKQKQPLKIDDFLVFFALLLNICVSIAIWYGVSQHANGYPTPPLPVASRSLFSRTPLSQVNNVISINNRTFFIVFVVSPFSLGCIKASVLFFYRRVFLPTGVEKLVPNLLTIFMLVVVFMWAVGFGFAYMFGCGTHFETYWATAGQEIVEQCINTQMILYATIISGFICDCIIISIPIPLVLKLHLDYKKKIAVIVTFLTGSLAVIASLIRLIWVVWENETPWNPDYDQMLMVSTFVFWSMVETHVGLIAACLPTLRRVVSSSSIDSAVHSVRSKFSIQSLHSRGSEEKQRSRNRSAPGSSQSDQYSRQI